MKVLTITEVRLRINELFLSLQGEADASGWPTVFIRLTGCPLRCNYCDTAYAFHEGEWMTLEAVTAQVDRYGVRHVCVTGGEPLAQKGTVALLSHLCDGGYRVSLETSGALDISRVDGRVSKVMDLKTPTSGEAERNRYDNIGHLAPTDQVKFVICNEEDYVWAKGVIDRYRLGERCQVLFSPSYAELEPRLLAEWILGDRLPVRFQLQMHKLLWGEERGR